jgi:hypothetical protein
MAVAPSPPCPHGSKTYRAGMWVCLGEPHPCQPEPASLSYPAPPPRLAASDAPPVSRVEWLDYVAECASKARFGVRHIDVTIAHVFTSGHFDYRTGEGTKHQTRSYLQERAGVSEGSAKGFLRCFSTVGLIAAMPGRDKVMGPGRATPLYRLTLP